MADYLVQALSQSSFRDIEFYCGVLQPANLDLLISGKAISASAAAVQLSEAAERALTQISDLHQALVIRSMEISNSPESVARMQLIALNSAIEVDIYGNANLSHRMGSHVINGIGGADVFAQNAFLSIMLLPSVSKKGEISSIVPKVPHQDISSHHIDVLITEKGVADLRGKTPLEKAEEIITNCSDLIYQNALRKYLNDSIQKVGGHAPLLLEDTFSWHKRLKETGSMVF